MRSNEVAQHEGISRGVSGDDQAGNCRVCGSGTLRTAYRRGPYAIAFCSNCFHGVPVPMPTEEELRAFYSNSHHSHALDDSVNTQERLGVIATLKKIAGTGRNLLDVGCGFGHYLDVAKKSGFDASGYDIDLGRAAACEAKGYRVWSGETLDSVPPAPKWDVVLLNHVIEHLRTPDEVLAKIRARMHKNSVLYVACPDFRCFRARVQGTHYQYVCPPEHIQYFSRNSLFLTLKKAGFKNLSFNYFTHELHVKDLFAYLLRGKWLKSPPYVLPGADDAPVKRFVDGRFPGLRLGAYSGLLAVSRGLIPFVNRMGGEHFDSYWGLDE